MTQADFRARPDGVIEYRYQMGVSNKRRWEHWEPVAIHAARNMPIPPEYLLGLREAGYEGGGKLLDLLQAEGWLVEKEEYLELASRSPYEMIDHTLEHGGAQAIEGARVAASIDREAQE
jgi:hypothetical protein